MSNIMKERPILFSGEMVRALLAGNKTQTRRIIKERDKREFSRSRDAFLECAQAYGADGLRSPYGQPGDRLWVKETHLPTAHGTFYRADLDPIEAAGIGGMYGGWKPSIFMRRELSRITLEITDIRVERLNDISERDAKEEGVEWWPALLPIPLYRDLWESINGPDSWEKNPWVWVIHFNKLSK